MLALGAGGFELVHRLGALRGGHTGAEHSGAESDLWIGPSHEIVQGSS